jgi:hypothetical protein
VPLPETVRQRQRWCYSGRGGSGGEMQRVASGGELSVAARRRRRQTVACSWDLRWRSRVSVIGCLSIAREPSVGRGEKNYGAVESANSPLGVRIAGGESVYAAAASIDEPGPRGVRVGPTRRLQLVAASERVSNVAFRTCTRRVDPSARVAPTPRHLPYSARSARRTSRPDSSGGTDSFVIPRSRVRASLIRR